MAVVNWWRAAGCRNVFFFRSIRAPCLFENALQRTIASAKSIFAQLVLKARVGFFQGRAVEAVRPSSSRFMVHPMVLPKGTFVVLLGFVGVTCGGFLRAQPYVRTVERRDGYPKPGAGVK